SLNAREGRLDPPGARRLVDHAGEPAVARRADPAARVVARAEIAADAQPLHLGQQRFLHTALAAELHERRHAVAQQLGDGERPEEPGAPGGPGRLPPRTPG